MRVVRVLDGDSSDDVKKMFQKRGWGVYGVDTDEPVTLVCFTGGADVSPSLYGEENIASHCDPARDVYEQDQYEGCLQDGIPMVGICRGGQFLNVMNGGKMIQDLSPRVSGDVLVATPSEMLELRVDHHQGILANWEDYSEDAVYTHQDTPIDYAGYFWSTKCLIFQPHPEWGHGGTESYFFRLIHKYLEV